MVRISKGWIGTLTTSPETVSGLPSGVSIMLVIVAAVAPAGTWNSAVASLQAHSYARKIRPLASSAFFTAVRATFSGVTDAKEWLTGKAPAWAVVATAVSG